MKTYNPTTASRRQMTTVTYRGVVTRAEPEKALTWGRARKVGRNNRGRITVQHKGSGHKRLFRDVDFVYDKVGIPAVIRSVEYDPNRSGFIGLAVYKDGEKRYVLLPKSVKAGDSFIVAADAPLKAGNRLPLGKMPVGAFVYNIELKARGGAKLARAAGNYAQIIAQDAGYTHVKLPSTEVRKIIDTAWASVGEVSKGEHWLTNIGKAGRSRWMGIRPTTRASVMNPVDHPYGGGEGRQGRGRRRAITAHGKPVGKGQKSRRAKKYSNVFIVSRRIVGNKRNVQQ